MGHTVGKGTSKRLKGRVSVNITRPCTSKTIWCLYPKPYILHSHTVNELNCVGLYVCEHMLGWFSSRAALEQRSHKQTSVLPRESAISLCRTASVLQQAINTESIIAPRGATGQGGQERHHLKGQCLERKQEGQGMMEAQGWKWGKTGRRAWAASDQMECKAGAICHPQAIHLGRLQYFPLDRSMRQQQEI